MVVSWVLTQGLYASVYGITIKKKKKFGFFSFQVHYIICIFSIIQVSKSKQINQIKIYSKLKLHVITKGSNKLKKNIKKKLFIFLFFKLPKNNKKQSLATKKI